MAGYQLFFPGKLRNAAECLRAAGLADFVAGSRESVVGVSSGTAGIGSGLLVGWDKDVGWYPERQKLVGVGAEYQLVLPTDGPVTPEEIARPQLFAGWDTKLADGQTWRVPVAAELPSDFRLVDRQWTKVRKPAFDQFWRESELWFRRLTELDFDMDRMLSESSQTAAEFLQQWAEFGVLALRQNYRINGPIASELGLFDSSTLLRLCFNVTDGMPRQEVLALAAEQVDLETAGLVPGGGAGEKKDGLASSIPAC